MKEIAKTYVRRIWDDKDLSAIDNLIDQNCLIHSLLGNFKGPDFMKKVVSSWLIAFPDLKVENLLVMAENDLVTIQWQAKGTHLGPFKEIEPKGKSVAYEGVTIYRINHGKITEYWAYLDMQQLLKQLI